MSVRDDAGLVHSFVVALIIVLVAFLIVFGLAVRTGFIANEEADTNLCRVTLVAQDLSKIGTGGLKLNSPLASACKRRTIEIDDNGIRLVKRGIDTKIPVYLKQGDALQRTTSYNLGPGGDENLRQQALASHFAESMRRCWVRGVEGKVEVFNPREKWHDVFDTKTVCMLCDETHVALSDRTPTKKAWLSSYITSTIMPTDKDKRTYGEYLYTLEEGENVWAPDWGKQRTTTAQSICIDEKRIEMNPVIREGSYATVFFRDFSTDETGCMAVAVVPAQQVRSLCDYVAN